MSWFQTNPPLEEDDLSDQEIFEEIDTNSDRFLSFAEVQADFKSNEPSISNAEILDLFKETDLNPDGIISQNEFPSAIKTEDEFEEGEIFLGGESPVKAQDSEGNGPNISKSNKVFYHPNDFNKDGTVDFQERQKALLKARQAIVSATY